MTARESTHGFLLQVGTRVYVTGTRHHGFWGTIVERTEDHSRRAQPVRLDQWPDEIRVFYLHNLIPDYAFPT